MSRARKLIREMFGDGDEGDYKITPGGQNKMLPRHAKWQNLKVGDRIRIYRDPLPDKAVKDGEDADEQYFAGLDAFIVFINDLAVTRAF